MSIQKKLTLIFLTFSLVLIFSMALLIKWSFHSGFKAYIKEQNQARLEEISERLGEYYAQEGDWSALSGNPRTLRRIIWPIGRLPPPATDAESRLSHHPKDRIPLHLLFILDTNKHSVLGRAPQPLPEEQSTAILNQQQVVGYVGFNYEKRQLNSRDERFARQQGRQLIVISIASVLLSLAFAWPISRFLVRKLHQLGQQIHEMSKGNYGTRIDDSGGDELAELSRHLNHLAMTLQQTEQSRRRWVADISHELRTPLATLRAQLEAIEDGISPYNETSHQRLNQQTRRLQQLVDDLYQLSLADAGALQYQKGDHKVEDLLEEAHESFAERFQQAGLRFHVDVTTAPDLHMFVDEQRFQQLLVNLLENSLRYTHSPGEVQLTARQNQTHLMITVEDSAPGIPESQIAHLFDRFYRGESSRNRATGGAGLGLNICRAIVEAHNGTIAAAPGNLGGIAITVKIPISTI